MSHNHICPQRRCPQGSHCGSRHSHLFLDAERSANTGSQTAVQSGCRRRGGKPFSPDSPPTPARVASASPSSTPCRMGSPPNPLRMQGLRQCSPSEKQWVGALLSPLPPAPRRPESWEAVSDLSPAQFTACTDAASKVCPAAQREQGGVTELVGRSPVPSSPLGSGGHRRAHPDLTTHLAPSGAPSLWEKPKSWWCLRPRSLSLTTLGPLPQPRFSSSSPCPPDAGGPLQVPPPPAGPWRSEQGPSKFCLKPTPSH